MGKVEKVEVIAVAYHRNGIAGCPFRVVLFLDLDGTRKVAIQMSDETGEDYGAEGMTAVLEVHKLCKGDVAFGSNSWRGDIFGERINATIGGGRE